MLKSQSTELFVSQEELQRITFFATQNQRNSCKPAIKYEEQYTFKPQINKKSANIQRTVDDLLRWNERKSQKLQQYYDDTTQELHQNANRLTHELDSNQPSVFERLYVIRKSNETMQQMTKRNTSDSHPYFTKNMSNTLYSEYKKQMTSSPEQQHSEPPQSEESASKQPTCLPNRLLFEQSERSEPEVRVTNYQQPKVTIPQHMFVDFREQIKQINEEPEPVPTKKPLNKKEIDIMVERMNNWVQKRNYKIQEQQDRQMQNESSECTFYPKLSNNNKVKQSIQNSQRVSQQSSYSNLFRNKNS